MVEHTSTAQDDGASSKVPTDEDPDKLPSRLPLTPVSSTSSFLQKDIPSAENGRPEVEATSHPVAQALKNLVLPQNFSNSRCRASAPVASVSLASSPSAHISNPAKLPVTPSYQNPKSLTSSATGWSRSKNTPPLTPRALSHDDGHQEKKSPLSRSSMAPDGDRSITKSAHQESSSSRSSSNNALPTESPKGKLSVKIDEARGLKPSYDPYVVCVFEWNEYISKGPRHDAMDVDQASPRTNTRKEASAYSAMPMRRIDSDMGKPMAIPMKSRQSSNNSEMDGQSRSSSLVTDPQWEHEATL